MKHHALIIFTFICFPSFGQYDTTSVNDALDKVLRMQVLDDPFYDSGLFRTQREWKGDEMEDNTLFYSANISYILQNLYRYLSNSKQVVVDTIIRRVHANVWRYANRKGEASYNFWQTSPDTPHPNGKAKHQKLKHGLPDDLDDSAILAMILENDSASQLLRRKMTNYATENNNRRVPKAPRGYRKTKAYRTWFADRWTQDLDIVVLCNVLAFIFENDYPLNQYDTASVSVIKSMLERRDHLKMPKEVSPYYGRTSVILYHIVRVLKADRNGVLESIENQVINELHEQLKLVHNEYERLLIFTALYRMDEKPVVEISEDKLGIDAADFYFFYSTSANLSLAGYKLWIIKTLGLIPNMYWKSKAFNQTVWLEFLIETGYVPKQDGIGND